MRGLALHQYVAGSDYESSLTQNQSRSTVGCRVHVVQTATNVRGCDRNQKQRRRATLARFDRIPLAFALCGSADLRSWTATRTACPCVSPSRSEGNRTRQWQMARVLSQKKAVGRLSADPQEASTCSWNRSFCARRRSTSGSAWSMCYRNRLPRRSAALRARFLRCVLSPHALEKKLASACVSQRS